MEDTLRERNRFEPYIVRVRVLILVLMEDTLREFEYVEFDGDGNVLILVLMEDTLRGRRVRRLQNNCYVS